MTSMHLDELLALGAGGSAGMVSLNGRFLGVVGAGNMVELDDDAEGFVAQFLPKPAEEPKPAAPRRGRPPAAKPEAPAEAPPAE